MLMEYIHSAMKKAKYEVISDDNRFYGEIAGFNGIYANAHTLEACRQELEEVLEEWILLRISRGLPQSDISKELLSRILKQAGIDRKAWEEL